MAGNIAPVRGTYGIRKRRLGESHPATQDAKRDMVAMSIETFVERKLADAPPLTDEQVERIATLLRGPSGAAV